MDNGQMIMDNLIRANMPQLKQRMILNPSNSMGLNTRLNL
jgi:hypothetical protein